MHPKLCVDCTADVPHPHAGLRTYRTVGYTPGCQTPERWEVADAIGMGRKLAVSFSVSLSVFKESAGGAQVDWLSSTTSWLHLCLVTLPVL
jgi:hypothetical protein